MTRLVLVLEIVVVRAGLANQREGRKERRADQPVDIAQHRSHRALLLIGRVLTILRWQGGELYADAKYTVGFLFEPNRATFEKIGWPGDATPGAAHRFSRRFSSSFSGL
jgi:hypothetical protein